MVKYWDHQGKIDFLIAFAAVVTFWTAPVVGAPTLLRVGDVASLGRMWLGPALTLLGTTATTTAFMFTVVDRQESKIIRGTSSESQLWRIFRQNIGWLAASAIYAAFVSFGTTGIAKPMAVLGSFLICMLVICVAKFAWVIRAVLAVRIDQATLQKPQG